MQPEGIKGWQLCVFQGGRLHDGLRWEHVGLSEKSEQKAGLTDLGYVSTIQQGGGPDGKDAMLRLLNYVQPQISLLQNRNRPRGEKKKEKKDKKNHDPLLLAPAPSPFLFLSW